MFFSPNDQSNPDRRVPTGHKEYLHLFSFGKLDDGSAGFITSLSLCEGDGSKSFPTDQYYINFHLRMPQYQGFLELFVSNDLRPLSSVPYTDASHNLFEQSEENALKMKALGIVHDTVRSFSAASVTDFLQKLKLYDTIGCTPVMKYGEENNLEEEAKETSAHGDKNRLAEQNPENRENKLKKETKELSACGDEKRLTELNPAESRENNLEKEAKELSACGDESRLTEQNPAESRENTMEKEAKEISVHEDENKRADQNPASRDVQLVIDPIKLQEMFQQCGGDHEKLVDLMQKLMASPENHTEAKDSRAITTRATHGERNEAQYSKRSNSSRTDCSDEF